MVVEYNYSQVVNPATRVVVKAGDVVTYVRLSRLQQAATYDYVAC